MTDDVRQIIARVPAWQDAQDVQIERIAGLTNANYRVTVDGERFVLRILRPCGRLPRLGSAPT
ncbi:MAG: hypothetical protein MUF84_19095 [Anaerolineae bacterium]|nr:hypothetical protein [Anaerolineae bacterium]